MGDRGRFVVPTVLRERAGVHEGRTVILVETPGGILLMTREQVRDLVRSGLRDSDLAGLLLEERRAAASQEDGA
jgi:bifunctional DNA-binding transcriptional regulator/antitoxin component of YhaV-PrlF toxin-antitoxin module